MTNKDSNDTKDGSRPESTPLPSYMRLLELAKAVVDLEHQLVKVVDALLVIFIELPMWKKLRVMCKVLIIFGASVFLPRCLGRRGRNSGY